MVLYCHLLVNIYSADKFLGLIFYPPHSSSIFIFFWGKICLHQIACAFRIAGETLITLKMLKEQTKQDRKTVKPISS
jgi:hypothetical protein